MELLILVVWGGEQYENELWAMLNRDKLQIRKFKRLGSMFVCVCVCVHILAHACACAHTCLS